MEKLKLKLDENSFKAIGQHSISSMANFEVPIRFVNEDEKAWLDGFVIRRVGDYANKVEQDGLSTIVTRMENEESH